MKRAVSAAREAKWGNQSNHNRKKNTARRDREQGFRIREQGGEFCVSALQGPACCPGDEWKNDKEQLKKSFLFLKHFIGSSNSLVPSLQ